MNQSSRDHTLLDIRPSPGPSRGAVSCQSSRDKRRKRSLPGTTVRKEGRAISAAPVFGCTACEHVFSPRAEQWTDLAATGCPRCHGWTWLVSLGDPATLVPARPAVAAIAALEEMDHV